MVTLLCITTWYDLLHQTMVRKGRFNAGFKRGLTNELAKLNYIVFKSECK